MLEGESEERFRALAEALDVMVFVTEPAGRMHWANGALTRQTGFRVEDFWFKNPDNPFLHPDDAARVGAAIAEFAESDGTKPLIIENRFFDKWGAVNHYRSTMSKVTWEGAPALQFVVGPASADTARAGHHDETYRRIVEAANDGIIKMSPAGRLYFANARFRELVGLDAVELGKRSVPELVAADARPSFLASALAVSSGPANSTFETQLLHRSGEMRWVSVSASRLTEGEDAGLLLALIRDVTEARRIEAGLRETQKLESLGVMAGGIAHDFNNIVTAILGNAALAEKIAEPGTRMEEILQELRQAAERAGGLTGSLLTYVGQTPTRSRRCDIGALVKASVPLLHTLISKAVVLEVTDENTAPAFVRGDEAQLSRILLNLVMNAAEAISTTGGGVFVEIGSTRIGAGEQLGYLPAAPAPGPYVVLRVRDTGVGISPALQDRIFDPFFTTKATGRGLGLSAMLGIVRSHGGAIRIESTLGVGSCFEVLLPRAASSESEEAAETEPVPAARGAAPVPAPGGAVLFVDDERSLRTLGKVILEDIGLEVVVAENAERALVLASEDPMRFRAAVVDHGLPGMRGDILLDRLSAICPGLALIQTSGYVDCAAPAESGAAKTFLAKPYSGEDLQKAVTDALRAPKS